MTIFDLSGDKEYETAVSENFNNLQIVLICYNMCDKASLAEAERWLTKFVPKSVLKTAVVNIVGCKKDLTKATVTCIHTETRLFSSRKVAG